MLAALAVAFSRQPTLRAVLCGPGTDELAVPAAIRSRTRLLGWREDVPSVMSACDIGALSSRSEAAPRVLLEHMACARPVVATDVGDCAEIVGDHGLIVPARDPGALAAALVQAASLAAHERAASGLKARAWVERRFDSRIAVERQAGLWTELIDMSIGG